MNREKRHIIWTRIALVLFFSISGMFRDANAQTALDFDGVDDYASASGVLTQTDNITLEAWVKPSEASSYNWIICLDIASLAIGTSDGKLTYLVNNSTAGGISTQALTLNQWSHVALVRRNGTYELYYNGTNVTPASYSIAPSISSGNLNISRGSGEIWQGGIDEVRIWSVARTSAEISANYNNEFSTAQTGLVAYYKMNEGVPGGSNTSITILSDASGNNHTASLSGFAMTGATSNFIGHTLASSCSNPTNGGTIGTAQDIAPGSTPGGLTQTVAPGGSPVGTLQYKWQLSVTSSSSSFADIAGANSSSYSPGTLSQNTWYKRLVKVDCESTWRESNVVQITVPNAVTWTGATSTNWNTASNWSPAVVPTSVIDATIPLGLTNYPVVASGTTASVKSLTNNAPGRTVTVNATGKLTVNGTYTAVSGTEIKVLTTN